MLKLIVFDWDDTFTLNSVEGYMACYTAAMHEIGQDRDYETVYKSARRFWGQPHEATFADLLNDTPELVQKACEFYEKHLFGGTYVSKLGIVNGAKDCIEDLSKSYKLAICTGAHPKVLKDTMVRFGIPDIFETILSSYELDDASLAKPNSYMLEYVMNQTGCTPTETIMVGDGDNDVEMAQNAGVTPVTVLTGHLTEQEAQEMGVKHILPDIGHLDEAIEKIA